MAPLSLIDQDARYAGLLLKAIAVCRNYKPKFGAGGDGMTLAQFQTVYGADAFYSWMGLDSPLMYAAHKASGGMTSVYRQIGIGMQFVFTQILVDHLDLTASDAVWSYTVEKIGSKKMRTLSLDGRIPLASVKDSAKRKRVEDWMKLCATKLGVDPKIMAALKGQFSKFAKVTRAWIRNVRTPTSRMPQPLTCRVTCRSRYWFRIRSTEPS